MKKRKFLKMSSAALAGAALSDLNGCKQVDPQGGQAAARLKNWAGNLEYGTGNVVYPESVEQVQAFVAKADKIRALGSKHCLTKTADSPHHLLWTKTLTKVAALDDARKTVPSRPAFAMGR